MSKGAAKAMNFINRDKTDKGLHLMTGGFNLLVYACVFCYAFLFYLIKGKILLLLIMMLVQAYMAIMG